MSSIPLPALAVQQQKQPDMMQQFGNLLALKSAMNQGQMQGQQLQGMQMENQQRQLQLQDQQRIRESFMQSGGDMDKFYDSAAKSGVSPQALIGIKNGILEQKQKLATLDRDSLANAKAQNDATGQAAGSALSLPPEQRKAALLGQIFPDLVNKGVMNPQQAQQYAAQVQQMDDASLEQFLKLHRYSAIAADKQITTAIEEQKAPSDIATARSNAAKAQAEATIKQNEAQYGPSGPAAEAKYRYILQKKSAGAALSAEELNFAKSYEASNAKTTSTSDSLGVTSTNTSRPAGLSMVRNPAPGSGGQQPNRPAAQSTRDSIVDLIGQYKYDPAQISRLMVKHPEIMAQVQQKYPDFDQTTYQAKSKIIQSMTSGPQSRELNAINTAIGHLGDFGEAAVALKNGNIQAINKLANAFNVNVGDTPVTTFRMIAHRVGPEIASAYIQGGGGEGERKGIEEDFSDAMSPDQIQANISKSIQLLRSKIGAMENQYKNTVGRDDFEQRFLTPQARTSLQKFGGGAQGGVGQHAPGAKANQPEGTAGTGSDGKRYVVKGGVWVPQ